MGAGAAAVRADDDGSGLTIASRLGLTTDARPVQGYDHVSDLHWHHAVMQRPYGSHSRATEHRNSP